MVRVGEVQANTGELQHDGQRNCRLASTGPDEGEGREKCKDDECKHSIPPIQLITFSKPIRDAGKSPLLRSPISHPEMRRNRLSHHAHMSSILMSC